MELKEIIRKIIEKYNNSFISITITAFYNKINILSGKYSLQKNKSLGNVIILDSPPLFDKGYDIKDARKQHPFAQEQMVNFATKMENYISKENLVIMYNNLHNLNIKEEDIALITLSFIIRLKMGVKKGAVGGFYSMKKNKIVTYSPKGNEFIRKLFKSESELTLEGEYSHELLHMSSTIKKKNKVCSGFYHYYIAPYINSSIGLGINEGYTDLLNERIFNVKNNGGLYEIYKIVSEMVENVVGKDKMTQLYFTANLKGLVLEMSRYISQHETKNFIINLDLMVKNPNKIKEIINYLLDLYTNKIKNDIANKKITTEEATSQYEDFKLKIIKLNEIFNQWHETKRKSSVVKFDNFDINSIFEEQEINLGGRSRGNIHFAALFIVLNLFALLITIIYLLTL